MLNCFQDCKALCFIVLFCKTSNCFPLDSIRFSKYTNQISVNTQIVWKITSDLGVTTEMGKRSPFLLYLLPGWDVKRILVWKKLQKKLLHCWSNLYSHQPHFFHWWLIYFWKERIEYADITKPLKTLQNFCTSISVSGLQLWDNFQDFMPNKMFLSLTRFCHFKSLRKTEKCVFSFYKEATKNHLVHA